MMSEQFSELFAFAQINGLYLNFWKFNTGFFQLLKHDADFPAVRRCGGPYFHRSLRCGCVKDLKLACALVAALRGL